MGNSKHRPQFKAKKKQNNIRKQKQREKMNEAKQELANMPVSYTYHKDATHVAVPMKAWQMLNALVKQLEPFAVLFSTMEQMGQEHINDGTLIPVFKDDIEVQMKDGAPLVINGQIQHQLKPDFWKKHPLRLPAEEAVEESAIVGLDGEPLKKDEPLIQA